MIASVRKALRRAGCQEGFQAAAPGRAAKSVPADVAPPAVAVVGVDGGRLQILERSGAVSEESAETVEPEEGKRGKHWREDKVGVLMHMTSEVSVTDPCPEIPETFVDPTKILRLARELKTKTAPRNKPIGRTGNWCFALSHA